MFNYKGRVVVVSGASSGLGRDMALAFAREGADVAITARRVEKLEELAKEIEELKVKALPVRCDVTDDKEIEEASKKVIETFGKVDVLVNCAGSSKGGPVESMTNDAWDFTVATYLTSVFKVTKSYLPYMIEKGYGRIINIASIYAFLGTSRNQAAYHSTKADVLGYTRAAAAELGSKGITVNAICPGFFATELTEGMFDTPEFKEQVKAIQPIARAGKCEELSPAAIFLGSEEASFVTGSSVVVDGGWSIYKY